MKKNITLAIQKEGEYIYDKIHNNDINLNIYDYLKGTGYSDLYEFRKDAKDYWVKSQNYEIVEEPEISSSVPVPYLNSKTPAFLYTINCAYNYAFIPTSYDNYDLIEEYGYTPVKLGYDNSNGPILSSDGDLRIYLIYFRLEIIFHPHLSIFIESHVYNIGSFAKCISYIASIFN